MKNLLLRLIAGCWVNGADAKGYGLGIGQCGTEGRKCEAAVVPDVGGSVPREYEGRKCVTADGECRTETEKGACGESAGGKLPESEATALQAGVQVELRVAFRTMARRNSKDGTASGSRVEEAASDVHLKDCGV